MRGLEAQHVAAMIAAPEGRAGAPIREQQHRMLLALNELASEFAARALAAAEHDKSLLVDTDEDGDPEDDI